MASKEIVCGIYKITNPNGMVYIGQSRNVLTRFRRHQRLKSNYGTLINQSLVEHGSESHTYEIVLECEAYCLDEKEDEFITLYDCTNPLKGLNRRRGGVSGKFSEQSKKQMSESRKAKIANDSTFLDKFMDASRRANKGAKRSEIARQNISNSLKKVIVDTTTGREFLGIEEASKAIGVQSYSLKAWLQGKYKNKSNLIYKV